MKKNKGFTLIELLAIIVILAIIAVITVPIILNVIDNSKKGAAKDSAYGFKDAVNKYYVSELYNNQNLKLNGEYTITDKGELSDGTNTYPIQVSGTTPSGGNLTYENNVLKNGCITIDEYKATIENGEVTIVEKGSCGEATASKFITIVTQTEEGKIQTGDELAIGTEHFYVVSSDENDTVLLAKYNLNVGNNTQPEEYGKIGMQNSMAIGYNSNTSTSVNGYFPATVPFSKNSYWTGKVGEGLTYPGNYNGPDFPNVYDINYVGELGTDNYSIAYYVEQYKEKIEGIGVNDIDARLLTDQEAVGLGCLANNTSSTCPIETDENSFITGTSFWLSSARSEGGVRIISSSGTFTSFTSGYDSYYGVRPVIVVNTDDI